MNNKKVTYGSPNIVYTESHRDAIKDIIESGWVSIGRYVEELQAEFREMTGVKHALACCNATNGLMIAVRSAGWEEEDIYMPSFTWPSTQYAAQCTGNSVKYLDIDPETWLATMSGQYPASKGILVDTFGSEAGDGTYDNNIIYDAAHGYGLPNLGKRGIAEVISFSFTKNVTAMEGGMILTDDDDLANKAKELIRLSARMEEINAMVALFSIETYHDIEWRAHRDNIATYMELLPTTVVRQKVPTAHNNSVFGVKFQDTETRDRVYDVLKAHNIETKIYYEPLVKGLHNTDDLYSKILALPIHSKLDTIPNICKLVDSVIV